MLKSEVADVNPATEGQVDVGDCQQDEGDEQGEEEDLGCVKGSVGGAEERGRQYGDEAPNEKNGPEDGRKTVDALDETGAAVLGEGAKFGHCVVQSYDFGRAGSFDGGEGLPHVAFEEMTFFGDFAVMHLGPVITDDGVGVVAGLLLEENALGIRKPLGNVIDVAQGVGFEVGVHVCFAEVGPDGVEHEAKNDGIGGAKDAELPADEIVVRGAPFPRPETVEQRQKEHGAGHCDDENHNILRQGQHEGLSISDWVVFTSLSKFYRFLPQNFRGDDVEPRRFARLHPTEDWSSGEGVW